MSFEEKLNSPSVNHKRIYKSIVDLIINDWKYVLRTKTSQVSLSKTFCDNNKDIRKLKHL